MSTSNYGLPDGTEDFVGAKAQELEFDFRGAP